MIEPLSKFNSGLSNKVSLIFRTILFEGETHEKADDYFSRIGASDHRSRARGRRAAENAPAAKGARVAQAVGRRLGPGHSDYRTEQGNNQVQGVRNHTPDRSFLEPVRGQGHHDGHAFHRTDDARL